MLSQVGWCCNNLFITIATYIERKSTKQHKCDHGPGCTIVQRIAGGVHLLLVSNLCYIQSIGQIIEHKSIKYRSVAYQQSSYNSITHAGS